MAEQATAEVAQSTNMNETAPNIATDTAPSNFPSRPPNDARCVYLARAFFGDQPFDVAEFVQKIKRYDLWYHKAVETEAEANVIIVGGNSAQRIVSIMISIQETNGLFVEDPSMTKKCQLIEEKVNIFLNAFSFPEDAEWQRHILRGPSIVIPAAKLRGKAFTAGGHSAAVQPTERSVSPPVIPPNAADKVPSTPERNARVTRAAATKPHNRIQIFLFLELLLLRLITFGSIEAHQKTRPMTQLEAISAMRAQWKKARRSLSPAKASRDQLKRSFDAIIEDEDGDRRDTDKRVGEIVENLLEAKARYKKARVDCETIGAKLRTFIAEIETFCAETKRELESM